MPFRVAAWQHMHRVFRCALCAIAERRVQEDLWSLSFVSSGAKRVRHQSVLQ